MFPCCRIVVVFTWLWLSVSTSARADEAAERWIAARLAMPIDIDGGIDDIQKRLRQLSEEIGVPIEIDAAAFHHEGLMFNTGRDLRVGRQPARDVLRAILLQQNPRDELCFIVVDNPDGRPEKPLKVVVTSRRAVARKAQFAAVADANDGQRLVAERLKRTVKWQHENNTFSRFVSRFSALLELPVVIDESLYYERIDRSFTSDATDGGERSLAELLEIFFQQTSPNQPLCYYAADDPDKRTPSAVCLVIATRSSVEQRAPFWPPADPHEADREMTPRLKQIVNLDSEREPLARHLQRLSEKISLPIDFDEPSLNKLGFDRERAFSVSLGNKSAAELLEVLLAWATGDRSLGYFVAEDERRRTPHRIRLVVASRSAINSNPVRFTPALMRPVNDGDDVEALLAKPITLELEQVPFATAIKAVADEACVPYRVHFGLNKTPISVHAAEHPFGEVLKKLLDDLFAADGGPSPPAFFVFRGPAVPLRVEITNHRYGEFNNWVLPRVYDEAAK